HLDPPGADGPYTEKSLRLESYWCYLPPPEAPQPIQVNRDCVTFGCLNGFHKASPQCLHTWAKLVAQVPGSRIIIHCKSGTHRQRIREVFADQQVDPGRLELTASLPLRDYLALYNRIDVILDPFPYHGGTTSCDGLWMGVPMVSLAGDI